VTETRDSTATPEQRPSVATDVRVGSLARVGLYYRQVVAELRKVVWPSRQQLVTYTMVVIVFVTVMIGIMALLDFVFSKGVLAVFG
jgi:preprotein translocase subunit SecE